MGIIIKEADRLNRLVTDLLDLDKMEAGKMEWELSLQDLAPVLTNAGHVFQAAASDKNITLTTDIDDALPKVKIDADRFSQLVANLLSNAVKFTPSGGKVTLVAQAGARDMLLDDDPLKKIVTISVIDTGHGILPDEVGSVFDRFKQTETGKKTKGGTGLGLAIAKEVAIAHGGDLSVESVLGEGTTFSITLPIEVD